MNELQIISLILLLLVAIDASSDALRASGKQVLHHSGEILQIAGWFAVWGLFEFSVLYPVMYILGRIIFFDIVYNICTRNKLSYVGESSIYGKILTWFTNLNWVKEQGFLIWVIRAMALLAWVILLIR